MKQVLLAPEAEQALLEIALYTLERWGEEQARSYVQRIRDACGRLADNPSLGRLRSRIRTTELRECQVGSHIVIYAVRADDLLVVGVLHEAMNLDSRRRALVMRMRQNGLL